MGSSQAVWFGSQPSAPLLCRMLWLAVWCCWPSPAQQSSVQDGIYVFRKAHMCSTLSLRSFPNIAFKKVPMFIWLMLALSRPTVQDGTYMLGKAHIHLTPSLVSLSDVALDTNVCLADDGPFSSFQGRVLGVSPLSASLVFRFVPAFGVSSSSTLHSFTIKQNMNMKRLDFIWEKISSNNWNFFQNQMCFI